MTLTVSGSPFLRHHRNAERGRELGLALLALCALLISACAASAAQPHAGTLAGSWTGEASAGSETTAIRLNISETGDTYTADLDLLDIGVLGWPAVNVERTPSGLDITIPSDSGPQTLTLDRTSSSQLTGEWREGDLPAARVYLSYAGESVAPEERRLTVAGPVGEIGLSIILPQDTPPIAGAVFVHGSGPQSRDADRFAAAMLAEHGIASVIYDKRGVGESGGDWRTADFYDLAEDAVRVAEALAAEASLALGRIGFIGTSQGGWISPIAANRREDTAFVITIAGPATTPAEEGHWNVIRALRGAGLGPDAEADAHALLGLWDEAVRTDGDFSAYQNALEAARGEPWMAVPGVRDGLFPQAPAEWVVAWYARILDFDPLPELRRLDAPLLALMGDQDEEQPWDRSAAILRRLAAEGQPVSVHVYADVNHAMRRVGPEGSAPRWPSRPADFFERQITFIQAEVE